MTRYVALYCRISIDRSGRREGVDAQEGWGREYAAKAWPGVEVRVFVDNDLSAGGGAYRPGFEALRGALGRGEVLHLWTVEQSRIERTEVGWFAFAAELDEAGVAELHTNRDGVVRVRDEVAGIRAVIAAGEVRKLRRRVRDKHAELAAQGRPAGGHPYGYRHAAAEDGTRTLEIIPEQAEVVRDSAERILAGWSLTSVADGLVARGLTGGQGGKITSQTIRGMLTNPAVAGFRIHHGRLTRGVWTPILDEETWRAVRDKLALPRVVQRSDGGTHPVRDLGTRPNTRSTGRRYLLTGGVATCGVCGAPLVGSVKQTRPGRRVPYYLCMRKAGGRSCIGIMADRFEAEVVDRMLDELDKPAFRDALAVDEHAERRDALTAAVRDVEARRSDLAAMWGDGELTAEEWRAARSALDQREHGLRVDLAAIPAPVAHIDPGLIRDAWGAMILDERREIIGMFIERVTVKRATPGTRSFDPRRVEIEWRRA